MKKLYILSVALLLSVVAAQSQPDVLFLMPGETSFIASRVFNTFKEFYRGSSYWLDVAKATKEQIDSYSYVVVLEETVDNNGIAGLSQSTYFGNSRGVKGRSYRYNSRFSQLSQYKLIALEYAFDLIKDLDPEYYEDMRKIFEKLGEKDN